MEVQRPEQANCGATCDTACLPLTENTGCKEARLLKRLRTEKSDAEDCPPSQASKLDTSSCPVQAQTSEQEVSVAPPATVLKQEPPIDPHPPTAEQQPTAAPPAHASKQEPAAVPCAVPSQSENEPAINRDTPQPPCNRVLLEPNLLLQQYVELLRSQHPQHVLQALNPLLLLSRNESHARVLAQYPPLFPALFSAIHAFHVAVDCRLLRCESSRTGTLAHSPQQPAAAAGCSDTLAGGEGTDEADPGCTQEAGDAAGPQKRADTTPEEAWQAQLAVAAATVVHHLAMVSGGCMSPESMSGVHIICLQHLALLNAQPWQPVLEVGLLLLSAARATIKAAVAFSSLNLCEHLLHIITDPSSPVQVKSLASSTVADALASGQRQQLIRHLSAHRPREPFEAAHALLRNTCRASHIAHMLPQNQASQLPLQGQYMAQLWRAHLVSCGVRLARELLTCVVAGYVNATVTSLQNNNMERISRTFKLSPSLHCCAPVTPTTLRHLTIRHRAARGVVSSPCGGGSDNGLNGVVSVADRASPFSDAFADVSAAHQHQMSGHASPAASAPTSPRGTRSQLMHSFPCLRYTGTDSGTPGIQPSQGAKAVTPATSTAAVAAVPHAQNPASAQQLASVQQPVAAQLCAHGEDTGTADADAELHPFAVPAAKEDFEAPSFLGEAVRPEMPFQPALSVEVEGGPGSPSLSMDNMPSFSRWASMSLSRSISFGGPRGADGEVPDSTLGSFGDAACGGSSAGGGGVVGGGGAESVHSQGTASPTFGTTVASRLSRPIMNLPQISLAPPLPSELYMDNGVTGSCDALPDVTFRNDITCGQSGDTLHVPPLLVKTLYDVATRLMHPPAVPDAGQSSLPRQASLSAQASLSTPPPPPAATATVNNTCTLADVQPDQPGDKKVVDAAPGQHNTDVAGAAPPITGAGNTSESQAAQAAQLNAGVRSANVESEAPSEKQDPGSVPEQGGTEQGTEVGQLQALVAVTNRQVAQAAEQALAVACQVPELAAQVQVPKQNGTCPEARIWPLQDSSGPGQEANLNLPALDSCLFAGLVNMSRGVAGTAVALDFLQ